MARLIVASSGAERTVELTPGKALSVGREPANDIPLPEERQASRRHCEVRQTEAGWEVVDLGATNKTRVNGQAVDRRALASGDVIEVGKVTLRFEDPQEEARLSEAGRKGVCFLEWSDGPKKGQRVLLDKPRTTLGRRESNTIVLDDRMASSHHAEIVKDLNGYTVRDLGSTNGILVNGAPSTESALSHGARLRVGNSRFVFKDPSMKDIEVELSRLEDDDGWGMMGDIDLSRAPGSKAGTLALLGVLGVVGVGGWYIWSEGQQIRAGGGAGGAGQRIVNGDFEGSELPWSWNEDAPLRVARTGAAGSQSLEARLEDGAGVRGELVTYDGEISVTDGRTLEIKARLKGSGELLAFWRNEADRSTGTTGVAQPVVLGSGGNVSARVAFPSWATALRLALRLAPGNRLTLDDLSVVPVTDAALAAVEWKLPGLPQASAEADGSLTLAVRRTVLGVGGRPVAFKGDERLVFRAQGAPSQSGTTVTVEGVFAGGGQELPGRAVYGVTEDGLSVALSCPGASRVGWSLDLPKAHVGPALNVLTASDARSAPVAVGPVADGVRKALVGTPEREGQRPPTLLAFAPAGEAAGLAVEEAGDPSLVRLVLLSAGAESRLTVVTDFSLQAKAAAGALAAAKDLVRSAPGAAIRELRKVAQEYPFEAKVQSEASQLASDLETRATKDLSDLKGALQSFRILGSPAALADLGQRAGALRATFLTSPEAPTEGTFEADVAAAVSAADAAARDFFSGRALPQVQRLDRTAAMLESAAGFKAMAAVVYRSIVSAYGSMAGDSGSLAEHVAKARARLSELEQQPEVMQALPPR